MRQKAIEVVGSDGEKIQCMSVAQLRADYRRRGVAETIVHDGKARVRISTVRLHSLRDYGPEIEALATHAGLDISEEWETMVFGGILDGEVDRFRSRTMARIMHRITVIAVRLNIDAERRVRDRRRRMHASYHARRA